MASWAGDHGVVDGGGLYPMMLRHSASQGFWLGEYPSAVRRCVLRTEMIPSSECTFLISTYVVSGGVLLIPTPVDTPSACCAL